MKIAIISDIHKKTKRLIKVLDFLNKEDIDYLICAGDIVLEENLKLIKDFGKPYVCVYGNNDFSLLNIAGYNIHKEPYYFKIDNISFKLMHLPFYMSGDSDIIIFGHTHKFEVNFINNSLFLNPGEVCAREKEISEFAILEIVDKLDYTVKYYFRKLGQNSFEFNIYNYKG